MEISLEELTQEIEDLQSELKEKLKDTKVVLSPSKDQRIIDAINIIFPDKFKGQSSYYISFDMYIECLKVIRKAGAIKAKTIIAKR